MRFDNWIAGEWVGSDTRLENINPSDTRDVIGLYAQANFDDLERSIKAATHAQKHWWATPLEARQVVLDRIGRTLMENAFKASTDELRAICLANSRRERTSVMFQPRLLAFSIS